MGTGLPFGVMEMLVVQPCECIHATELFTFKRFVVCRVNFTSMFLKAKKTNHLGSF